MRIIEPTVPPPGFVHVDLDGLWTLAGCYGYPEGDTYADDPVFTAGLPRLLALLDELDLKATFFIVGRDLMHPAKAAAVCEIARRGHELASHGWSHRFDLEALSDDDLAVEINRTSEALAALTGTRPLGFRAPGYTAGPRLLTALSRAGLRYDGSALPTRAAPLLRWAAGRLRAQVRREQAVSGETGMVHLNSESVDPQAPAAGATRQYAGGGPLRPVWFHPPGSGQPPENRVTPPILRLPVAVSPVLRLPLHASLGLFFGARFVTGGLRRLARRGWPVVYLLHGMDALGVEDLAGRLPAALARSKPFQTSLAAKLAFLREVLPELHRLTRVSRTGDWVAGL